MGWWATDSQGSDTRTATFHQTLVTSNEIACSVKGVLEIYGLFSLLSSTGLWDCPDFS